MDPATKPPADGIVHKPATSGESPSTCCRYCAMNRKLPKVTNNVSVFVASEMPKDGIWNRPMSSNGSDSERCLRMKITPMMPPPTKHNADANPKPPSAARLMP